MARDDGFTIADVAAGHLGDDKFRDLWRRVGDQGAMCEAVTLHLAVLLASWSAGRRVSLDHALPLWLEARQERVDDLVAVGLLDRRRMIPVRSWTSWFGPAQSRREVRREAGRKGGKAPRKQSASNAKASLNPTVRPTVLPSVPSEGKQGVIEGTGARAIESPVNPVEKTR
jgi:hypothetical protein